MSKIPAYVFLNGRILKTERARVSALDRGFLYGDGLFETIRAYRGKPFALNDHLARLRRSAKHLGLRVPPYDWPGEIQKLLRRCRLLAVDAAVRITVTRGAGAPGLQRPVKTTPTVLIMALPIAASKARDQLHGVEVVVLPFGRAGFLAEHKRLDYLPAILGRIYARKHGACEGLYVDDGCISEATTANLFVVRNRRLITPPLGTLLPGVTRQLVFKAARLEGIEVRESRIRVESLASAAEAFLTSALIEVTPVVGIDGAAVGNGAAGVVTRRIQARYRQMIDQALSLRVSR